MNQSIKSHIRIWSLVFSAYMFVRIFWGLAFLKAMLLPISVFLLWISKNAYVAAVFVGVLMSLLYFFIHDYSGTHDLKSALIILNLIVPIAFIEKARIPVKVSEWDIISFLLAFFMVSILFMGGSLVINTFDQSQERFRGFILPSLMMVLVVLYKGNWKHRILIYILVTAFFFQISGHRGMSMTMFVSFLIVWMKKDWLLPLIPIFFAAVPFGSIAYLYLNPGASDNIAIRGLSSLLVLEKINLFGNGMALPVVEFQQVNKFDHFFVPADVLYFGQIYELGFFIFFVKALFLSYFAKYYWNRCDRRVVTVILSFAIFGYNLTYDIAMFVASTLVFGYFAKIRKSRLVQLFRINP